MFWHVSMCGARFSVLAGTSVPAVDAQPDGRASTLSVRHMNSITYRARPELS